MKSAAMTGKLCGQLNFLLTNRVHPSRAGDRIQELRQAFHDAAWQESFDKARALLQLIEQMSMPAMVHGSH